MASISNVFHLLNVFVLTVLPTLVVGKAALGSVVRRGDDIYSWQSAVQTLSQQVAALTAKVQALETTPPRDVAFFVQFSEYHHAFGHDNALLQFDNVLTNVGNAYHPQSGKFVAPESGTYAFYLNLLSDHGADTWQNVCIMHNEACAALTQMRDAASSLSVMLQLVAGDYVWAMKTEGPGATIYGINHSTFSGMLVTPAAAARGPLVG